MMSETDKELIYGNLYIHPASRSVYMAGQEIALTKMEFDVLYLLTSNPNVAFARERIYEAVGKDSHAGSSHTIRDVVHRLRAKLEINNIQTLYGYGYRFNTYD